MERPVALRIDQILCVFSVCSYVCLSTLSKTGRMRILVVDDDRAVRESLRRSLEFQTATRSNWPATVRRRSRRSSPTGRTRWSWTS